MPRLNLRCSAWMNNLATGYVNKYASCRKWSNQLNFIKRKKAIWINKTKCQEYKMGFNLQ